MSVSSTELFDVQAVVTATPAKVGETGVRRLMKVVFYCAAIGKCEFKNAATDTGTVLLTIAGLADTSVEHDFTDVGGLEFSTAIFAKPTGTGNIAYVWYQ